MRFVFFLSPFSSSLNTGAGIALTPSSLLPLSFLEFLCFFIVAQGSPLTHMIASREENTFFFKSAKAVTTLGSLACLHEFLVKEMQAQD